jgi:hypothetical protein
MCIITHYLGRNGGPVGGKRLAETVQDADLAPFLAQLDADHRRSVRPRPQASRRAQRTALRRYGRWCREVSHGVDPEFVTSEVLVRHVKWMTGHERLHPSTVAVALWALADYCDANGVRHPPADTEARQVLDAYRKQLRQAGKLRQRRAR